jgi:hypothetical protein
METKKLYNILELGKMPMTQLVAIANDANIEIKKDLKQVLIYSILDHQAHKNQGNLLPEPSELNARDRYAVADQITDKSNFHPGLHDYSNRL